MKITDQGKAAQFRWVVTDESGGTVAGFTEYKTAVVYVIQVRQAKRKNGL